MPQLPSGTVTFLFTDIEGSTQLLRQIGPHYAEVLAEHQRIVREAAAAHGGHEVDTQGDSFFIAFPRGKDAVGAAVAAQRDLHTHAWPEGVQVKVRMGLHTGEPRVGEQRYVGMGVHKAARIGAAGHGGQVLLSATTRELVEDELPSGVTIRDLGERRLKDVERPERLSQLVIEGLPSEFDALKTIDVELARRRRRMYVGSALIGVLAAAVAIPVFAPRPEREDGMATAAASTPISAEPRYIRRRRRASSTSMVFSASNSLGRPSITSCDRRSGRSTSFSRRMPRSRIVTPGGSSSSTSSARRRREQHLPAVARGPDARGLVDAHADVALLADPGLAGVQAHPHLDLDAFGPRVRMEVALRRHRGRRPHPSRVGRR